MARRRAVPRPPRRPRGARGKIRALLPASFRSHLKASIREGLLAFESLFDEAVRALEREGRRPPVGRARKIKVG